LTANLQLRRCCNPSTRTAGGDAPNVRVIRACTNHWSPISGSPCMTSQRRPLRPAPSVQLRVWRPCRVLPLDIDLSVDALRRAARLLLPRRLVKDDGYVETRTPSIDEYSLLRAGDVSALDLRLTPSASGRGSRLASCPDLDLRLGQNEENGIFESPPPARIRVPASSAGLGYPKTPKTDTSRRLLQSKQPTSTTTNRPTPGRPSKQHPQLALG
jgi:hypothetical protein